MPTRGFSGRERLDGYLREVAAGAGEALVLKVGSPPRMRAHGQLSGLGGTPLDRGTLAEIASAIIPPAIAERLAKRRHAEFAYGIDGIGRFRVAAYSQRGSLALQFRTVSTDPPVLEDLALPARVQDLAKEPSGIVIVAGPPGSGRTTTLHAMVDYLNRTRGRFLVTVEEPVEVLHKDIAGAVVQLEVGRDVATTASGVRTAVRHDADVVMVGQVDDAEVAQSSLSAAEAGLLVLVGLEAAPGAEPTELFIGLSPAEARDRARLRLAGTLTGVMSQQLLPRRGGTGRVAAVEVRSATTRAREALLDGERLDAEDEDARWGGETIEHALAALCAAGVIDLRTALTAAPRWSVLNQQLASHGIETAAS